MWGTTGYDDWTLGIQAGRYHLDVGQHRLAQVLLFQKGFAAELLPAAILEGEPAMRTGIFALFVAALTLLQAGCAAGFRAGGRNEGVDAGAAIGPTKAPVVVYPPEGSPPPLAR